MKRRQVFMTFLALPALVLAGWPASPAARAKTNPQSAAVLEFTFYMWSAGIVCDRARVETNATQRSNELVMVNANLLLAKSWAAKLKPVYPALKTETLDSLIGAKWSATRCTDISKFAGGYEAAFGYNTRLTRVTNLALEMALAVDCATSNPSRPWTYRKNTNNYLNAIINVAKLLKLNTLEAQAILNACDVRMNFSMEETKRDKAFLDVIKWLTELRSQYHLSLETQDNGGIEILSSGSLKNRDVYELGAQLGLAEKYAEFYYANTINQADAKQLARTAVTESYKLVAGKRGINRVTLERLRKAEFDADGQYRIDLTMVSLENVTKLRKRTDQMSHVYLLGEVLAMAEAYTKSSDRPKVKEFLLTAINLAKELALDTTSLEKFSGQLDSMQFEDMRIQLLGLRAVYREMV